MVLTDGQRGAEEIAARADHPRVVALEPVGRAELTGRVLAPAPDVVAVAIRIAAEAAGEVGAGPDALDCRAAVHSHADGAATDAAGRIHKSARDFARRRDDLYRVFTA